MTSTKTAQISYRKTQGGEWVAFGPASAIKAGATVTVTKRDGTTKTEHIIRTGRPFSANGTECVYGYLAPKASKPRRHSYSDLAEDFGFVPGCRHCGRNHTGNC